MLYNTLKSETDTLNDREHIINLFLVVIEKIKGENSSIISIDVKEAVQKFFKRVEFLKVSGVLDLLDIFGAGDELNKHF